MQQPSNYDSDFCGSIPLHLTNLVQPYGVLLVLDKDTYEIIQASDNTSGVFGKHVSEIVNSPLSTFINPEGLGLLTDKLRDDLTSRIPALWTINGKQFVVLIHRTDRYLLVEIDGTPLMAADQDNFVKFYQELKYAMEAIEGADTLDKACTIAASELKRISGFDKVMIYRFDPDWNGYVIAESGEPDMESYFHFTFPASDIPKQARQLYLKNPYRLIPDRNYQPVKLYPVVNPITNSFIDLSGCNLRSVAAVHLEYLKNMGVTASMSTRILYEEKLWGLIACHHKTPRYLTYEMCAVFEMLSGILSMKIASVQNNQAAGKQNFIASSWAAIVEAVYKSEDLYSSLLAPDGAMKLLGATGIVLAKGDRFTTGGITPDPEALQELMLWLNTKDLRRCFATNALRQDYEYAKELNGDVSGMLVIPINQSKDQYLLLFRPEQVSLINWGGNPEERIQFEKDERNYHPRNSFKQWQQKVCGISVPWSNEEMAAAEMLRSFIYEYETTPII